MVTKINQLKVKSMNNKIKTIVCVLFMMVIETIHGQGIYYDLKADSVFKHQFKSKRQFIKDLESPYARKSNKKTKWEYGHYKLKITDSTIVYSKGDTSKQMKFYVKESNIYDENYYLVEMYADNKCGNEINIKIVYDDRGETVVIYFYDEDRKFKAVYFTASYE